MKNFSVNNIKLNYLEKNQEKKEAILFLHGNSHSLRSYANQFDSKELADFRLIFVDLPGHGESSKEGEYSLRNFSQILTEFVKTLELESLIVVGHSMGGHVAINMLKTLTPNGLFLFGTPPLKNPFSPEGFLANANAAALQKTDPTLEEIDSLMNEMSYTGDNKVERIEDFLAADSRFRLDIFNDIIAGVHENEVELLNSFSGAITFLLASGETLVNNNYIRQQFSFSPNENVSLVDMDCGHSPQIEVNGEFDRLLANFCKLNFTKDHNIYNISKNESSQNEQRNQ